MEVFAKQTRRRLSSVLSDLGIEVDSEAKERRQYYEGKYDHTKKKENVQALKKWKKERKQYLLNEFHNRHINGTDEFSENLTQTETAMPTDGCRRTSMTSQMIGNMYQPPTKLEISQRPCGRNQRFSTSDVDTRSGTFENTKHTYKMKTSISFHETDHLQTNYQNENTLRKSQTMFFSGQGRLQKLNRHWQILKENAVLHIRGQQESHDSINSSSSDQRVTKDDSQFQKLKQTFRNAFEEVERIRQKSAEALTNIKDKCQKCCFSDRNSVSSARTDLTDLSIPNSRRQKRLEKEVVKEFPFCAEYDGYTSRRTKTISESIQAILEERKNQEEIVLRQEIERQVTNILTMRMLYKSQIQGNDDETADDMQNYNFTDKSPGNEINMQENEVIEADTDNLTEFSEDWVSGPYLNITIEHSEPRNDLKVTISSIENLFSLTDAWKHQKVYVTASLVPRDEVRKQKTKARKGNDMVEFQDDLYFRNLKSHVVYYSIRFKVYHKTNNMLTCCRPRCVGEALVWLDDFDLKEKVETRVEILSYF